MKPIKSRHGLTRCTACRAHIRAAERPSATRCPFCGADMHTGQRLISAPAGRSGALAGALLAFSLSACGGADAPPAQEPTDQHADDNTNQPVSGDEPPPSDDQYADDPADDNAAVAEYGMAMPEDQYEEEPADSPRPTPRYGLPPGRR